MSYSSPDVRFFSKYPGIAFGFFLATIVLFYFILQSSACDPSACAGVEIETSLHRFLFYLIFSFLIGMIPIFILFASKKPGTLSAASNSSHKQLRNFTLLFMALGAILVSAYAVPIEYNLANNYHYCYETTGEYRKDSHYFDQKSSRRGVPIPDALYVRNSLDCPDRLLFMYWYDEEGTKFESFDTHPKDLELEIETLHRQ